MNLKKQFDINKKNAINKNIYKKISKKANNKTNKKVYLQYLS